MNRLQDYFWFIGPDRKFLKLSYRLRNLSGRLNNLNERRKILQNEYTSLKQIDKCQKCNGKCCGGNYVPYFSGIDYLIRMFSDKPITDYTNWWTPPSIITLFVEKIKSLGTSSNLAKITDTSRNVPESRCPYLSQNGCTLKAQDRPMRCILWICDDVKKSLPPDVLRKLGIINKELSSISAEVIKSFAQKS
jgi:Fe-S-cluster containining protein